ncbi:hypothetical protein K090096B2_01140 [Bacteroides fragilis]
MIKDTTQKKNAVLLLKVIKANGRIAKAIIAELWNPKDIMTGITDRYFFLSRNNIIKANNIIG